LAGTVDYCYDIFQPSFPNSREQGVAKGVAHAQTQSRNSTTHIYPDAFNYAIQSGHGATLVRPATKLEGINCSRCVAKSIQIIVYGYHGILYNYGLALAGGKLLSNPSYQAYLLIASTQCLIGFEPLTGIHSGRNMATVVHNVLERFKITNRLFCITTDNASNNGVMRRELEDILGGLERESSWNSDATKIPCMAHVLQLVVKAILNAFKVDMEEEAINSTNIPAEDDASVTTAIYKVGAPRVTLNSNANQLYLPRYAL
jgi:hypothetical protein